jgi:hypothetical protein
LLESPIGDGKWNLAMRKVNTTLEPHLKYQRSLEEWAMHPDQGYDQLMDAICRVKLGDLPGAKHHFVLSLNLFLGERRFWMDTSEPQLLMESYMLAGAPTELYRSVRKEIDGYKLDPRGNSGVALYSYATVRLIGGDDEGASSFASALQGRIKVKWLVALGASLQAIVRGDQPTFDSALSSLIGAHRGMAKYGDLRESPEGYLSLAGMSLSKIAMDRGMEVTLASEYLSTEYLQYIQQCSPSDLTSG